MSTHRLAQYYAYTHMLQHYDAMWSVLQLHSGIVGTLIHNGDIRAGIVDLGCGPLTASLALADEYAANIKTLLKADVVGVDHAPGALSLAARFFNCGHLHLESRFLTLPEARAETTREACRFLRDKRTIVFLASYFFGQPSLGDPGQVAAFCKTILATIEPVEAVLVYLNASTTQASSNCVAFAHELGVARAERRMDYEFRVYRQLRRTPEPSRIATEGEPLTYSVYSLDRIRHATA